MLAGRPQRTTRHRVYPLLLKRRDDILVHARVLTRDAGAEIYTHVDDCIFTCFFNTYPSLLIYRTKLDYICSSSVANTWSKLEEGG